MDTQTIIVAGVAIRLKKALTVGERELDGGGLERRAAEWRAYGDELVGKHLLTRWEQRDSGLIIPPRRRLLVLCTGWRHPERPRDIKVLVADDMGRLKDEWRWIDGYWFENAWLLMPFGDEPR